MVNRKEGESMSHDSQSEDFINNVGAGNTARN